MLGGLEAILHGVLDIPFLVIGLLVQSLNGWIMAIGLLIKTVVAVLPSFPAIPTVPVAAAGAVAWVAPMGAIVGVFVVCVALYVTTMGVKIAMNWGKVRL